MSHISGSACPGSSPHGTTGPPGGPPLSAPLSQCSLHQPLLVLGDTVLRSCPELGEMDWLAAEDISNALSISTAELCICWHQQGSLLNGQMVRMRKRWQSVVSALSSAGGPWGVPRKPRLAAAKASLVSRWFGFGYQLGGIITIPHSLTFAIC